MIQPELYLIGGDEDFQKAGPLWHRFQPVKFSPCAVKIPISGGFFHSLRKA